MTVNKQNVVIAGIVGVGLALLVWGLSALRPKQDQMVQVVAPQAPLSQALRQPADPKPTDWKACIDGETAPDNKTQKFRAVLRNHCSVSMSSFNVLFKMYDASDSRVGWANTNVGGLEPGEKVKFDIEYPEKDHPLLKNGVSRVAIFELAAEVN